MEYHKKIEVYNRKIKDKKTLLFVHFLQTLGEWLDRLMELKRISQEAEPEIKGAFPQRIFGELDALPAHLTDTKYNQLKKLLLGESTRFVHTIITFGDIRLHDFDLLQFNLYQIFGKEELASMVEWSRLHLQEEIEARKKEERRQKAAKKKADREYLAHVRSMSQSELRKRAIRLMFDYRPSARTPDERNQVITDHRKKIIGHRRTFHKFEEKLVDATVEARKASETHVYQRMGVVRRHMDTVAGKFRTKAKLFASAEGPRKKIEHAKNKIEERSVVLTEQMAEAGEQWEEQFSWKVAVSQKHLVQRKSELSDTIQAKGTQWKDDFLIDVASARDRISTQTRKLGASLGEKGKEWQESFQHDAEKARKKISIEQAKLGKDTSEKKVDIKKHGEEEFKEAYSAIQQHRSEFLGDITIARGKFTAKEEVFEDKRQEMGAAKVDFKTKRDRAAETFLSRGGEIEESMSRTIIREKGEFEQARNVAREKFATRAIEISGSAATYIGGKKKEFKRKHADAQGKFIDLSTPGTAGHAAHNITHAHRTVMEEGRRRREIMQQNMRRQRDLFQYDVRFAQARIKKNAEEFGDKVQGKQEEFVERGMQLVARHKARQKATLIRNLLRTIRTSR